MSKGKKDENATMLRDYVHRALANKSKGVDTTSYANLVKELSTLRKKAQKDRSDLATWHLLSNMIHALKDCVSTLRERKHDGLLNEVLGMNLWNVEPIVRDAILEFIGNLVIANAAFTHTCLQLLVCSFLPPHVPAQQEVDQGEWKMTEEATMVHAALLATLSKVLQMVPTAPTKLLQLLTQHMPHKLRDRNTQCMYMSAMLSLAEAGAGAPIRDGILATAVEHALSIDVEIRWEDIVDAPTGQEAEEGQSDDDDEQEDIFELEGMTELDINATPEELLIRHRQQAQAASDRGGWEGATVHSVASTSGRPAVDETANKLDSLMDLLFEHLARRHRSVGTASNVWSPLLSIFERSILNTQRSKFTQFLVFFVCSKQPQPCAAAFVDLLLTRLNDARQPAITRSACAAYTASFLARSAFVPPNLILDSLQRLLLMCRGYAESATSSSGPKAAGPPMLRSKSDTRLDTHASNLAQHQVFYAAVQSLLYILCYQLRSLMQEAAHGGQIAAATRQLVRSELVPLLNHRLAPLLVCLPSVAAEFKHQAGVLGLLDAADLTSVPADNNRAQRPLEMFFPFDPYLLTRSSKHLNFKESYVRWRHGHPSLHATAAGGAAAEIQGASDDDDLEASDGDEEADELAGMDDASVDEESSDDDLEGMSLPSDSILPRPGLASGGHAALSSKPADAVPGHASVVGIHGAFRPKPGSGAEDVVMSYSPGYLSSIGDMTPTGQSPVLVNYISPSGASPMQMTPVLSHMDAVPSRLHRR